MKWRILPLLGLVATLWSCNEVDLHLEEQDPTAVLTMEQLYDGGYDGAYDSFYVVPPYTHLKGVNFDASRVRRAVESIARTDSEVSLVFVKDSVATAYAVMSYMGTRPNSLVSFKGYSPTTRLRCVKGRCLELAGDSLQ